jgi:hypothetical protein
MTATPVPPPPIGRWLRLADAADRLGMTSPAILLAEISLGRAQIRAARLGKRSLIHVAASDVEKFAQRLAAGVHV